MYQYNCYSVSKVELSISPFGVYLGFSICIPLVNSGVYIFKVLLHFNVNLADSILCQSEDKVCQCIYKPKGKCFRFIQVYSCCLGYFTLA